MIQRLPAPENCCNGSITKYVIMFRIVEKRLLAPDIWLMNVEAPRVAKAAQPGQFVIVRGTDDGERIPLTVADYDREQGTISIVIQAVGASTRKIVALEEGGALADFAGRSVSRRSSYTKLRRLCVPGSSFLSPEAWVRRRFIRR